MAGFSRLKRRAEFLAVAGRGRKHARGSLLVQALPNANGMRFGFTATKKLGNAVTRNRAKRRMRAAVRAELSDVTGHDIVLVAREAIRDNSFESLRSDLRAALDKLGVPR